MMRWVRETNLTADKTPILVLRDEMQVPFALVMEDRKAGAGYAAVIIAQGMPSRSGFKHTFSAALWAQRYIARLHNVKFAKPLPVLRP